MKTLKMKVPDTFVILFVAILLAAVATWVVPGGKFKRQTINDGVSKREVIVKDSFTIEKNVPQSVSVFKAPLEGFKRMSEIIGFIFLVGGAFFIFDKTGAINAGISWLVKTFKGKEKFIIFLIMMTFSFFGAFFGMCEEAIPFVLVFVPLALAMGYDSITGLCFSFLSAGVGFATAFFNPFTVQIAQRLAEIPPISGWEFRVVIWLLVSLFTIYWVIRYAERIKKNPELSPTYEADKERRKTLEKETRDIGAFNLRHGLVLLVMLVGIVFLFLGVIVWKWYIMELAALFIAMGLVGGLVGGLDANKLAKSFLEGAKDIASAALVIAFAGGIVFILETGNIMDTILYGLSRMTGDSQPLLSSYIMYVIQMGLNFFIPSGTTKAALTMPLFVPLADLTGMTRQTAILAYQFGDGFTNMIIPTSGVTVGTLAMAKVPFEKWFKWLLPLQICFVIISLLFLFLAVTFKWTGL